MVRNTHLTRFKLSFFENDIVTDETYQNMLMRSSFNRFKELEEAFIYHRDNALPHYSYGLKVIFDRNMSDWWNRRTAAVLWP